jgi:hypothetical protein
MSYTNAPACGLLATNCCVCGRPLVDAISVSLGIGPECRSGFDGGIDKETQEKANKITYEAAIAAQEGRVAEVRVHADALRGLGLDVLAEKVAERFINAERNAKIKITEEGSFLKVVTPFRRGESQAFIDAWRSIPGRRYSNRANLVPVDQKQALWNLLQQFFPNQYAIGPKGVFRIPKGPEAEQQAA